MKKMFSLAIALGALAVAGTVQAAGNVAAGKALSSSCGACHGPTGNTRTPDTPKLAGQNQGYLVKQLSDFQTGKRKNAIMKSQVDALCKGKTPAACQQAFKDLAAFYASKKTSIGGADKNLVALGRGIYRGGNPSKGLSSCMGCHGANGAGNPGAKFPALSGQNTAYIIAQLKAFRQAGEVPVPPKDISKMKGRTNDANRMMQKIAARMSDREIKAVASYISGLY